MLIILKFNTFCKREEKNVEPSWLKSSITAIGYSLSFKNLVKFLKNIKMSSVKSRFKGFINLKLLW